MSHSYLARYPNPKAIFRGYPLKAAGQSINSAITYLKKLLPGVKFVVSGFAASEPVGDNSTAEGKAANRRAEIFIP